MKPIRIIAIVVVVLGGIVVFSTIDDLVSPNIKQVLDNIVKTEDELNYQKCKDAMPDERYEMLGAFSKCLEKYGLTRNNAPPGDKTIDELYPPLR